MTQDAAVVRAARLCKRFGGITAVDAVEFVVAEGELVGLIGPNGSGKTTLVNLLTGHLAPESGDIYLRGRRVNGLAAYDFAARGVGRTFQMTQLFRRMSVLENMLVPGLTRPQSTPAAVAARARVHLEFLSIAHLEHLPAKNLSGGQQKLLEIGRALMLDPTLLFLDEPFAGVHPHLRGEIIERIRRLHASGRTFVIVDHDMEAIQQLARRLVVMARGQIIADGPPSLVRGDRAVLAAYAEL
jgi:branched-chain amino acid transport system ATP-binding protein